MWREGDLRVALGAWRAARWLGCLGKKEDPGASPWLPAGQDGEGGEFGEKGRSKPSPPKPELRNAERGETAPSADGSCPGLARADTHPPPSGCRAGTSWPARSLRPPAPARRVPGAPGRGPAPAGRAAARGSAWSRRTAPGCAFQTEERQQDVDLGELRRRPRRCCRLRQAPTLYGSPVGGVGGSSAADPRALTSPYSAPGRLDNRP